jgi:tripartite ATP-independent transporter DctP family solute receptor
MKKLMLGATALTLLTGAAASAQEVSLRYAHVGTEGDIQTRFAEEFAAEVADRSDGRIEITVFPASQLGGVAEMVNGVRSGAISMGHHDFASLAQIVPEVAVFNAPFVYRDGAHAVAATDPETEAVQEINEQLVEEGGIRVIGRIYRGARHISSNFPVEKPADLEGQPFRAVPLDLWVSMVRGFGAIPTPIEVSELPTALMTGVVVGQENPLTMINANKLYEVQEHISLTGHMQSILSVFVNDEAWQDLTEEDRALITEVLDEKAGESLQWAQESEQELIAEIESHGVTFHTEDNGLDLDAFRQSVLRQINQDFPNFDPYIEQISEVE